MVLFKNNVNKAFREPYNIENFLNFIFIKDLKAKTQDREMELMVIKNNRKTIIKTESKISQNLSGLSSVKLFFI
jgi:hypothetical protein